MMKKIILSASLILASIPALNVLPDQTIEAQAKSYDLRAATVSALKKGTFPGAKATLNTKKSKIAKMSGIQWIMFDLYQQKEEITYVYSVDGATNSSKMKLITKFYDYKVSKSSFDKNFKFVTKKYNAHLGGDATPYTYVYKAGNYYVSYENLGNNTLVSVSKNKKWLLYNANY